MTPLFNASLTLGLICLLFPNAQFSLRNSGCNGPIDTGFTMDWFEGISKQAIQTI